MSKRPRESTSSRLRRTRLPASSAARGADSSSTRASTPSPTGNPSSPIRRRAVALSSSSRSWAESTASSRLALDIALLSPTSADCTATCSMRSGRPPVARSSRRTSWACVSRSTCWPPADRTRRRNSSTAAPSRGEWWDGTGSGPTRTTDSYGWPAVVSAVTTTRASLVLSSTACSIGPASVASRSRPSSTSRHSRPSTARPRAPTRESPGAVSASTHCSAATSRSSRLRRARASTHQVSVPAATWRTMSVLPLPGGPTTVTQRDSSSAAPSARWTSSRPRHGDSTGRIYRPRDRS